MSEMRSQQPGAGREETEGHPAEDVLIALALGEGGEQARLHVESCQQCRAYVDGVREVKESMVSLAQHDPPQELADLIWSEIRRPRLADSVQSVLHSPLSRTFLYGLIVVFYTIFMYAMIALLDMG